MKVNKIIDKIIIKVIIVFITLAGLIAAISIVYMPETTMSFWDGNPFLVKKSIKDNIKTIIVSILAIMGLALQVTYIFKEESLKPRLYSNKFYIRFIIGGIVVTIFLAYYLLTLGNYIARKTWQPLIVNDMMKSFESAKLIVKNKGLYNNQVNIVNQLDKKIIIRNNIDQAERNVGNIMKLFDINNYPNNLQGRINLVEKYFDK